MTEHGYVAIHQDELDRLNAVNTLALRLLEPGSKATKSKGVRRYLVKKGSSNSVLPQVDLAALETFIEDLEDHVAVAEHLADMATGNVLLLTDEQVGRILDGEAPLRVIREARDLSQSALSERSGVTRNQISQIENGHAKGSVETLQKLSEALGCTIEDLV